MWRNQTLTGSSQKPTTNTLLWRRLRAQKQITTGFAQGRGLCTGPPSPQAPAHEAPPQGRSAQNHHLFWDIPEHKAPPARIAHRDARGQREGLPGGALRARRLLHHLPVEEDEAPPLQVGRHLGDGPRPPRAAPRMRQGWGLRLSGCQPERAPHFW